MQLLSKDDSKVVVLLTSTNITLNDTVLFYTPDEESFCMSLVNIDFIQIGNDEKHEYFPCTWITDIDKIILTKGNSTLILPGDSYAFKVEMKMRNISPYLRNGKYRIVASLSYENGNFESELDYPIFRGFTVSNKIEISK